MNSRAKKYPEALGLQIQHEQLLEWAPKLSAPLYLDLCKEAGRRNSTLPKDATCDDVWRGQDLNNFINNWSPAQ